MDISMSRSLSKRPKRVKSDALEVVCRLKCSEGNDPCVVAQDEEHVCLFPPSSYARNGSEQSREQIYRFGHVFEGSDSQRKVFSRCCMDFLQDLVSGKNALLFAYGVTGSGKTYTMTGNNADSGILPRAADVLFNSIPTLAPRCAFAPDGKNGFLIRSELAALEEQRKLPPLEYEMSRRSRESKHTKTFPSGMVATVFVSYVEVYNDYCYDLLDNSLTSNNRLNMNKNVRIDNNGNAFLDRLTEVEVQSSDEVLLQYMEAQDRRKIARTLLNSTSSRSHSIFNIRLVMAQSREMSADVFDSWPVNDESKVIVSQLSMVDLAGSERAKRTNNCGDRLAEANKINQSLLYLRNCFNQLRSNTNVSYRDCKLTLIFKNFFEGFGRIRMIVCVNPQPQDYEENVFVMSFAEVAQSVDIQLQSRAPPLPLGDIVNLAYSGRDMKKWYREMEGALSDNVTLSFDTATPPPLALNASDDVDSIRVMREFYSERLSKHKALFEAFESNAKIFEAHFLSRLCTSDLDRRKIEELEATLEEANLEHESALATSRQLKQELVALKRRLYAYESRNDNEKRREEELQESQRACLERLRKERRTMQKVSRLMEMPVQTTPSTSHVAELLKQYEQQVQSAPQPANVARGRRNRRSRKGSATEARPNGKREMSAHPPLIRGLKAENDAFGTPTSIYGGGSGFINPRFHRRSRSVGGTGRVLSHEPAHKIPIGTVLQPDFPKGTVRTSRLDVTDLKRCDEYVALEQRVDVRGNLTNKLFKGTIVPTAGGGTSVLFNDVETLRQRSPTASSVVTESEGAP